MVCGFPPHSGANLFSWKEHGLRGGLGRDRSRLSLSLTSRPSDICQDGNQVLFKACPGTKEVPCERTVHMGQSEDPRCPLHLVLPPPMFQPEQEASLPEALGAASRDMYLSAAELQPTENLPLEFSDVGTHP